MSGLSNNIIRRTTLLYYVVHGERANNEAICQALDYDKNAGTRDPSLAAKTQRLAFITGGFQREPKKLLILCLKNGRLILEQTAVSNCNYANKPTLKEIREPHGHANGAKCFRLI